MELGSRRPAIAVQPQRFHQAADIAGAREGLRATGHLGVLRRAPRPSRTSRWTSTSDEVTALIGPSGLRQEHADPLPQPDERSDARARGSTGELLYHGEDLYGPKVDPVQVRQLIGMVFQKPNPFPKSIYDNIAFGPRDPRHEEGTWTRSSSRRCGAPRSGTRSRIASTSNAFGLSGGQQQRLCIARCIAVEPDVILMDEPCSALDPVSTGKIEDLMHGAQGEVLDRRSSPTTCSRPLASRDRTAFLMVELDSTEQNRWGGSSSTTRPRRSSPTPPIQRTEDYVSGRVG